MEKLIDISFAPANFILTLLMLVMVLYWIVIIFTGLDLDLDADVDAEVNSADVGNVEGQGFWTAVWEFFYIGELPVMFIITLVVFSMWLINVNVTALLGISDNILGFLVYLPGFVVSMLITKVVAKPFVKLYAVFNHKGEIPIDFIGKVGRAVIPMSKDKMGQIDIMFENDVLKVYAKSIDDDVIAYGDTVIILEESPDKKFYYAQKYQP